MLEGLAVMIEFDTYKISSFCDTIVVEYSYSDEGNYEGNYDGAIKTGYTITLRGGNGKGDGWNFFRSRNSIYYVNGFGLDD